MESFRLFALASATNDLSGVPQLLARLPQPTVFAGQTHRVGPQQAHFREAGAECGTHLLKGKQAESGMEKFLTDRLSFAMFYITVLSSKPPPTPCAHQNQRTSSVKIGHCLRSSAKRSNAPSLNSSSSSVYSIPFFSSPPPFGFFCPLSVQNRTRWKRHNPEGYLEARGASPPHLQRTPANERSICDVHRLHGGGGTRIHLFHWPASDLYTLGEGLAEDAAAHSDTRRKSNNLKTAWIRNRWIFLGGLIEETVFTARASAGLIHWQCSVRGC